MAFKGLFTLFALLARISYGCDTEDLDNFAIADTDRNGYLDMEELCIAQEQEEELCASDFAIYDLNGNDQITCQGKPF